MTCRCGTRTGRWCTAVDCANNRPPVPLAVIGQAVDKRPGAAGRRARYDVYGFNGALVHLRLREWVRPDGTVDGLGGQRTDALWASQQRFHIHVNRARNWSRA